MLEHTNGTEDPVDAGSSVMSGPRRGPRRGAAVVALALVAALLLTAVVRAWVLDVYWVGSVSMEPTLRPGDRVLVNKLLSARDLQRGDLVVFDGRGSLDPLHSGRPWYVQAASRAGQWLGLTGSDTSYVKRVAGVAGDTVTCCDADGRLSVNGQPQSEEYVYPDDAPSDIPFTVHVPRDRVWLMGDHRSQSVDSRSLLGAPGGGLIRTERVIGTAQRVLWPPDRAGGL